MDRGRTHDAEAEGGEMEKQGERDVRAARQTSTMRRW